jgi:hypothetical protein
VRAGVATLTADLRGVQVSAVSISGGTNLFDLRLPHPSGTVPIHMRDGSAKVSIRRPAGVAVRATFPDGAARVRFDERGLGPILNKTPVESPQYHDVTDRYDVEFLAAVAELTIGS